MIINPPKTGWTMWFYAHKAMFCNGSATAGLNEVGGIMIKAGYLRGPRSVMPYPHTSPPRDKQLRS